MTTEARLHGDPRHHADDIAKLKGRLDEGRQEAREEYARACEAEAALVAAKAEIARLQTENAGLRGEEYPIGFTYGTPYVPMRANVTEPVNDRIKVPLLDLTGESRQANMQLSVPQALELAALLTTAVGRFCERWDIAQALRRREPLGCPGDAA